MSAAGNNRYLAFELGKECYAVEVERVVVVLDPVPITRVPKAPAYLKGVINFRGSVIPIADMGARFGESGQEQHKRIVVLQILYADASLTIGLLADAVREVVEIAPERIGPPPRLSDGGDDRLVSGIGEVDGEFMIILDIDRVFETAAGEVGGGRARDRSAETQ